jgi:tRNA U34 5-methylaminomethyl-2-thiouridine-forming methyltransferase MnmC
MSYALRRQPNGSYAVYHLGLRETMHPHLGPWAEATRLYAGGSGLERALTGRAQPGERAELVVFDVGLGGAANALAAIACREGIVRAGRQARPLAIVSFERELAALAFALDQAERLDYLSGHVAAVRAILAAGAWEAPGVRWELRQGDFVQLIQVEPRRADIVFYDPFSHRTNPELWSVPVLQAVYRSRRPGSGQRLVTYSSAFGVRAALLLAGYFVGEGVRLDGRPTTLAATSFADLEQPLDPVWLGRWRRDREPWSAMRNGASSRPTLPARPYGRAATTGSRGPRRRTRGMHASTAPGPCRPRRAVPGRIKPSGGSVAGTRPLRPDAAVAPGAGGMDQPFRVICPSHGLPALAVARIAWRWTSFMLREPPPLKSSCWIYTPSVSASRKSPPTCATAT